MKEREAIEIQCEITRIGQTTGRSIIIMSINSLSYNAILKV